MLLPHGFEGQGPEHSSARLERFLTLAAEDNMRVANLTTPAQIFPRAPPTGESKQRKPLVVMTPKSLLRHPQAVSKLEDFSEGAFQKVIPDQGERSPEHAPFIILCSGKVYYDLLDARKADAELRLMSPFFGLSSSTRSRGMSWLMCWQITLTARRSGGFKRSLRTWARGASFASALMPMHSIDSSWSGFPDQSPPAQRQGLVQVINWSKLA